MASQSFITLLEKLLTKTQERQLQWHETASEDAFRIALGGGLVRIERGLEPGGGEYYVAYLQNRKGRTLDVLGPLDRDTAEKRMLRDIFEVARTSALGVDRIIDNMLADVDAGRVEFPPSEDEVEESK